MGSTVSTVRQEISNAIQDNEEKAKQVEGLRVIERLVHGQLDKKKVEIVEGRRNDRQIYAGTVVQLQEFVYVAKDTKSTLPEDLNDVIENIFQKEIVSAVVKLVRFTADGILTNTSAGEHEATDMFIVWSNNALVRCDMYYYRWNFTSKGVVTDIESSLGVLLVKRVLDLRQTDPQVLVWAISKTAEKLEAANPMIDAAFNMLQKALSVQKFLRLDDTKDSAEQTD